MASRAEAPCAIRHGGRRRPDGSGACDRAAADRLLLQLVAAGAGQPRVGRAGSSLIVAGGADLGRSLALLRRCRPLAIPDGRRLPGRGADRRARAGRRAPRRARPRRARCPADRCSVGTRGRRRRRLDPRPNLVGRADRRRARRLVARDARGVGSHHRLGAARSLPGRSSSIPARAERPLAARLASPAVLLLAHPVRFGSLGPVVAVVVGEHDRLYRRARDRLRRVRAPWSPAGPSTRRPTRLDRGCTSAGEPPA